MSVSTLIDTDTVCLTVDDITQWVVVCFSNQHKEVVTEKWQIG